VIKTSGLTVNLEFPSALQKPHCNVNEIHTAKQEPHSESLKKQTAKQGTRQNKKKNHGKQILSENLWPRVSTIKLNTWQRIRREERALYRVLWFSCSV
jgi:hypothetical protein